jgi:aminoglycoside phosphotransferase (APT) family kinase protein
VLAADVAAFFAALHAFPVEEARALGVPERTLDVAALRAEVMPALASALDEREVSTLDRWWAEMQATPAWDGERVLCHIDAWHENMLVDPATSRLTGALDFGDAGIDDPACDFAPLRHLGDAFADAVLAAYRGRGLGGDPSFAERIERYWQLREFWGVRWSLRNRDSAEFADAVRKLRAGPVLR